MNETLLTWIVFILAFGGMVLIHEFGHFIVARLCGIEVEEFGIGLPTPGAVTLFTWQGTRFTLNWLPLGGFVRPKGENDPNVPGGLASASPWKRLAVLFAGPLMNLLAAVVIYSIIFNRVGVPDTSRVLIASVSPETPAAAAGFQDGDIFVSGNGQSINSYEELRQIIDSNVDQPIDFVVSRDGKQVELTVTPHMNETEKRAMIGVGLGVPFKPRASITETLGLGVQYTGYSVRALISLPAQLLRGSVSPEQGRIIGLKGIYDVLQQSVSHDVEASSNPAPTAAAPARARFLQVSGTRRSWSQRNRYPTANTSTPPPSAPSPLAPTTTRTQSATSGSSPTPRSAPPSSPGTRSSVSTWFEIP